MFWTIILSMVGALMGLGVYIYYLKQGQFDDLEDIKYEMFRHEEEDKK